MKDRKLDNILQKASKSNPIYTFATLSETRSQGEKHQYGMKGNLQNQTAGLFHSQVSAKSL
jgi:hypothetical protein